MAGYAHRNKYSAYNHLNLPITFTKGTSVITITYAADGTKLSKAVTGGGAIKNYVSGIAYSGANVEAIYHVEGRCTPNGTAFYYEYTIKDHLGNARVNFRANGTTATHLEEMHYYPFGMLIEGLGTVSPINDYSYNGKELNDDFGLNLSDYGARWYDASVGRWWGVDPLAEKYGGWSGYNYTMGNPVRFIDPDGMSVEGDYFDWGGNYLGNDNIDDKKVYVADKVDNGNFINAKDLGVTIQEFKDIVGTVYSEMDATQYTWEEGAAIYDVLENRSSMATIADGKTITVLDVAATSGVYGYGKRGQIEGIDTGNDTGAKAKLSTARSAVINAMFYSNSQKDWSNGATTWHGDDLGNLNYYTKLGITFTDPSHNVLGLKDNPQTHTVQGNTFTNYYQTTAGSGRTTFMKRTQESLKASYPSSYPNIPSKQMRRIW